ncbi:hypothetical protein HNP33_003216 [Comamonas odontotermitis]|uniref:Uncharacterized protein n=1 Tax=Comamonas odontotermitis TaxID=379895 RepID=A0ABR6RIX1_9BURK|nr:hypothetical protein [Comamonas odontotermitis]
MRGTAPAANTQKCGLRHPKGDHSRMHCFYHSTKTAMCKKLSTIAVCKCLNTCTALERISIVASRVFNHLAVIGQFTRA